MFHLFFLNLSKLALKTYFCYVNIQRAATFNLFPGQLIFFGYCKGSGEQQNVITMSPTIGLLNSSLEGNPLP